ncbi:MAG: protein kinase [Gemmatimonadota bacterium]
MTSPIVSLTSALADRYRIERELGAGGMATVYLAEDLKHHRKVAIKVLRPELAAVIGAERFLREIATIATLQHPHILGLIDSGEVNGTAYYVMPFVEGESLRDRLNREKQLPINDAVRLATEVAGALDYAHRHGVIHRDIKPENILLHDGSALVADFGIALAVSHAGGSRMTETGMSLGTPHYMSPEQAMGEREITARSDVYALGCVTYEMLIGEPPFTGPTAQAIVAKVMTEKPALLIARRDRVTPAIEDAVLTALEKLPADRFATAAEFAAALAGGAGPSPRLRTRAAQSTVWRSRFPLVLGAVALAVAAVAALLVLRRPATGDTSAVRVITSGARVGGTFGPGLAFAPDGHSFIFIVQADNSVRLRRWERLLAEPISQLKGEACCVTFSPSGDTIAYLSAPRQLSILALQGDVTPRALPELDLLSVTDLTGGIDWGRDGFVYAVSQKGLIRVDVMTGKSTTVTEYDSARGQAYFLSPQVLPKANGALVTVVDLKAPGDPTRTVIAVVDFATGKATNVTPGVRAIYSPTGHLVVVRATGVLWALPFDAGTLRATGAARELADTVAVRASGAVPGFADMALSQDGTLTYVKGSNSIYDLVWVDRTGVTRPVFNGLEVRNMSGVAMAPDGRLVLALDAGDLTLQLYTYAGTGDRPTRLTFDGAGNIRPQWRPGTGTITYTSDRETPNDPRLKLFEVTTSGAIRPLAIGDPRRVGSHIWSPDGKWLVFRTDNQDPGGGDILAIRPGVDTIAHSLVATPAEELAPSLSPDGRWLAFSSDESGRREVYVRPFPNAGDGRYQVTSGGGSQPVWSATGKELFFIDAAQNMAAAPVTSGASFRSGSPRVLFSASSYALNPFAPQYLPSRDGQRFLMARDRTGSTYELETVFHFLDDMKRRMAAR